MFERFEQLLKDKNPHFICTPAGSRTAPHPHVAYIDHVVTPGLDSAALAQLRRQVPDQPTLWAFYEQYGSARLYRDSVAKQDGYRASAYYLAAPEEWARLREDANDWLDAIPEEEREGFLPAWLSNYIVIGEIPRAATYFLIPLVGDDRGKVFEFDHDGFEFTVRGNNFEEFVEALADTGPEHLDHISGHTRYYDGSTTLQWMPETYHTGGVDAPEFR